MTVDLESKINGITDDLADLVRNLDEKKAALQAQDKLNLLNDKRRKGDGLEKSRQDLLDQIEALKRAKEEALAGNGIGGVSDKVLKAIEDRQAALEKQLNELDNLRRTKQD
jgi:archaellum component FlaC